MLNPNSKWGKATKNLHTLRAYKKRWGWGQICPWGKKPVLVRYKRGRERKELRGEVISLSLFKNVTFTCFCCPNSPGLGSCSGGRGQNNSGNIFDFYLRRHRWQKWEYDGDPLKFSQIPGRNLKISTRAQKLIFTHFPPSLIHCWCLFAGYILLSWSPPSEYWELCKPCL